MSESHSSYRSARKSLRIRSLVGICLVFSRKAAAQAEGIFSAPSQNSMRSGSPAKDVVLPDAREDVTTGELAGETSGAQTAVLPDEAAEGEGEVEEGGNADDEEDDPSTIADGAVWRG